MRRDKVWYRPLAVDFIKSYVRHARADGVVLGVSGGIDSAVCLALSINALDKGKVTGLWMPYGETNIKYIDIVKKHFYPVRFLNKPIESIVDSAASVAESTDDLRRGNLMARARMMLLYDFARGNDLLVINTSNRSEIMTGYFTKWGDGAGDLAPIANLYKNEVMEVAKELRIPNEIIQRVPSADFWEGQTDEDGLGISYEDLDNILEGFEIISRAKSTWEGYIAQRHLEAQHSIEKIDHVLEMIQSTAHKRQRIPNPDNWYGVDVESPEEVGE